MRYRYKRKRREVTVFESIRNNMLAQAIMKKDGYNSWPVAFMGNTECDQNKDKEPHVTVISYLSVYPISGVALTSEIFYG